MFRAIKFLLICALLATVIAGGLTVWGKRYLTAWSETPVTLSEPSVFEFPRGTKLADLGALLEESKVIDRAILFRAWVRFFSSYEKYQAGQYRFEGQVRPREVAEAMIRGDVYIPVVLQFTIPEGFTQKQVIDRLVELNVGKREDFEQLVRDKSFLMELGVDAESLEGFLYPATYQFSEFPGPREALVSVVTTFWSKLPEGYENSVRDLGLSLVEAVTFASLIELETRLDAERPLVSEVIWTRLKRGMPLGLDASIIYGIQDYQGDLTFKHLKDASNPYNTRIRLGLPPGPIGSPSIASLKAVLSPANEGNLYYVLDPEDGTKHIFSKTLREHNNHVRNLVRHRRGR
ncbi:MAG: endolytic transglycosylase MltG [Bdellovibrionales bacterium]|nr:endolytic transglycosylase MltG [Bdellovibrionales bacterium]